MEIYKKRIQTRHQTRRQANTIIFEMDFGMRVGLSSFVWDWEGDFGVGFSPCISFTTIAYIEVIIARKEGRTA